MAVPTQGRKRGSCPGEASRQDRAARGSRHGGTERRGCRRSSRGRPRSPRAPRRGRRWACPGWERQRARPQRWIFFVLHEVVEGQPLPGAAPGGFVQVIQTSWIPATASPRTRTSKLSVLALADEVSTPVIVGGADSAGVTGIARLHMVAGSSVRGSHSTTPCCCCRKAGNQCPRTCAASSSATRSGAGPE